ADPLRRSQMEAQIAASLTASSSTPGPQIQAVVLHFNHRTVPPLRYESWVPAGAPLAPLYYQLTGSTPRPAIDVVHPDQRPQPFTLPQELAQAPFSSLAAAPGASALAGCLGKTLFIFSRTALLATKSLHAQCTSLSWDAGGNLWIAATNKVMMLPRALTAAAARKSLVQVYLPWLAPTPAASITALRIAPDGVRVAMIVRVGSSRKIIVLAISKTEFTFLGQTSQMLRVGSDIADPTALTWLDPDHLLAIGGSDPRKSLLYEVPLNGSASREVATPRGITSVTASWPHGQQQPQVVIAIAPTTTSAGKIEGSTTDPLNPTWAQIGEGATPVFPG